MLEWQNQAKVNWDCKYRVVILSKSRRKGWYVRMRHAIGQILRDLCQQKAIGLVGGEEVAARPRPGRA
jgi:REP element-mobilizing transposase RayT